MHRFGAAVPFQEASGVSPQVMAPGCCRRGLADSLCRRVVTRVLTADVSMTGRHSNFYDPGKPGDCFLKMRMIGEQPHSTWSRT